ncbi:hypothetical protein Esi_0665_0002 [Ectocarpus siliculosus]|uniref:Uncharacterized protein n=1 Tax=Ectocarpus siliculosus TaxID=2880 RepID=D7G5M8_ECTSI|nr:hypothetical protein Esi_0665_0002 [Ectocarpus siliculosus]|eukprot:CBJ33874.1 hypothetical protein Esi_0665_0002 [Ectocarpus siliculosus]
MPANGLPTHTHALARALQVSAMRVSAIKEELDERGVGYRGLFDKSEFVDLLVDARAEGITAPPLSSSGDTDGGAGSGGGASAQAQDKADAAYKDVEGVQRDQGAFAFEESEWSLLLDVAPLIVLMTLDTFCVLDDT